MNVSANVISLSHANMKSTKMLILYVIASRVMGHQSNCTGSDAARDATAATPNVLNINEPIIVPSPMSDSVTNVLITFVKNSGVVVATAF